MHNPYQAPASATLGPDSGLARRPLAVWSLALLFAAYGAAAGVGLCRDLTNIALFWFADAPGRPFFAPVALRAAGLVAALAGAAGILRRRQWGRWVGLCAIAALVVLVMAMPDRRHDADDAELAGANFARLIFIPGMLLWWGYRFGFSAKAGLYFADARTTTDSTPAST